MVVVIFRMGMMLIYKEREREDEGVVENDIRTPSLKSLMMDGD